MSSLTQANLAIPILTNPTPNRSISTYNALLAALTSSAHLIHLKEVHAQVLRSKLDRTSNSLLIKLVLTSCALSSPSLDYALSVFCEVKNPETRICNKLLRELSHGPNPEKALVVYEKMRREGLSLDRFSFPSLLKAVSKICALNEGLEIHGLALKMAFDSDPFIQTGLVGMYGACGHIMDARLVFDRMSYRDIVAWTIMIESYCQSGAFDNVFKLFEEMKSSSLVPDEMILCTILSACGKAGNLSYGKAVHDYIKGNNILLDSHLQSAVVNMYACCGAMDLAQQLYDQSPSKDLVVSTAMVSGYSKHGQVAKARSIFDQMIKKDLVCWSSMISGYAESYQPQEAIKLFNEMQNQGLVPDQITLLSVISACAHLGALDQAKRIQIYVDRNGFGRILSINNALIDMYAKCGSLERARKVFESMPRKNVISWSSMISAFAIHGDASNAISLFHMMKETNIKPNAVTFVGVLYACSHAGMVEEGREIFSSMISEYGITPRHEHYGCMVDLYCRANILREAIEVIETMPLAPNVVIWGSLMAACRVHGEAELGEFAAKRLLELEPDHDGALVVLSNIYAKGKRWEDVGQVRKLMKRIGVSKERGCSRIELNSEVHEFLMADKRHNQADQIYKQLNKVVGRLKLVGYSPSTSEILVNVEEEEKEDLVLWHSEKLAVCFGLISARKEPCLRIVKNLRICEDCHTFMKLVSKVYQMEIIVRDRTRFHHYTDGNCSCKDYW